MEARGRLWNFSDIVEDVHIHSAAEGIKISINVASGQKPENAPILRCWLKPSPVVRSHAAGAMVAPKREDKAN